MTTFEQMKLGGPILRALRDNGYSTPTPIQMQAIPPALAGRDLLGSAQTGTGKTAAFALPTLHRLAGMNRAEPRGPRLPRVLVLSPTRELATQIADSFAAYGSHTGLQQTVIYGGVSQSGQVKSLQRGTDVLVATPGRLMDLMEQRLVNLSQIAVFVLDEADRMLDMGFIRPIRRIAAALPAPPARQTLLFSATMPPPIRELATALLHDPIHVSVAPVAQTTALIEQRVYKVSRPQKAVLLRHFLADREIRRALVFTKTKFGAERLSRHLNQFGIASDAIHGNKAQNQRKRALDRFRGDAVRVLVATDVAARGLDVDGISHVFNFDLPMEPEAYVHRIGRTGRAGASGVAISFCDGDEFKLLRAIEQTIGARVPSAELPKTLTTEPAVPPRREPVSVPRPSHNPRRHDPGMREARRNARKRSANRGRYVAR
ncbi:MAG: DEAD/DEAH box helicase [Phycisphaerales bacterium]|nr:DEAD/DEAH box helicase [Phycisphaerales bacterium]